MFFLREQGVITEMVKDLILVVDLIELATENKEKIEI